jgi:predicted CXXCH cytochrome family protein
LHRRKPNDGFHRKTNLKEGKQMKKVLILAVALVLVATGVSFAAIANSKHDLTTAGGYTGATLSSCQYCHTPHLRSNPSVSGAPLWNRTQGTNGSWTMYGTTLGNTTTNSNPGANSRTCLSCHDGTVALGSVLVGSGGTITKANVADANGILGNANLGVDLSNEHPIGFTFVANRGGVPTVASPFKLYGGTFECASCHDPHDTTNAPFLRSAVSGICSACHTAK